jgi:hypothetical protein
LHACYKATDLLDKALCILNEERCVFGLEFNGYSIVRAMPRFKQDVIRLTPSGIQQPRPDKVTMQRTPKSRVLCEATAAQEEQGARRVEARVIRAIDRKPKATCREF